jgi:hypothetical protein
MVNLVFLYARVIAVAKVRTLGFLFNPIRRRVHQHIDQYWLRYCYSYFYSQLSI